MKDEALKLALDFLMTRRMGAESVIDALQEALAHGTYSVYTTPPAAPQKGGATCKE